MHYYNKAVFNRLLSEMQLYDHIIYEIMKQNLVKEIVTVNKKDFKKYKDIAVIVPERN